MDKIERQLRALPAALRSKYLAYYRKVLADRRVRKMIESGKLDTKTLDRVCDKFLPDFKEDLYSLIEKDVVKAFKEGVRNSVPAFLGDYKGDNTKLAKTMAENAAKEVRRNAALASQFLESHQISKRVWRYGEQTKKDMAVVLDNGITAGKPASEIAKKLKSYLNNPNMLFRRVRDKETGELRLSKAARDYHPGQGVYRSSYANAMRLSRTEVNSAYRDAEYNAYLNNPLVIGYEIRLSNNHTTKLPNGKVVPLYDICDELEGVYPKWFKWSSWHPNCRCRIIPITLKDAGFAEFIKARREGKLSQFSRKYNIKQLPDNAIQWLADNRERLLLAADRDKLPYFLRDNGTIQDGEWVANK